MYIISPAQEVIQYTLPNSGTNQTTSYYAARLGGLTQTMESLKAMAHPGVWPNVKNHITTSLAIVKNLSDFAQELSQMYEHHAEELQLLVGNYRKKNAELRKEGTRGSTAMVHLWESLLQEVEADSQAHGEIASVLGRQVSRHTLEKTFYRKVEARKLLAHRESLDSIIARSEDTLSKCRQDYKAAFLSHTQSPGNSVALAAYLDAHNTYVTQLHATNAMVDTYCRETLPELLNELDNVYADLCTTLTEAIAQGAEIISNRAGAQSRRYCTIWSESKSIDPSSDTAALVRNSAVPSQPHPTHRLRLFTAPTSDDQQEGATPLKNALVFERPASIQPTQGYEALIAEQENLQTQIQHLQDSLANMLRIQQRSIESSLFNKANEIQEDISMKRYDLKTAQINLAAVKAKRELFAVKMEGADSGVAGGPDRKMSTASAASMKNKWLKAFKSLKTPPNGKEVEKEKKHQMYHAVSTIIAMRRNGKDLNLSSGENAHQFQEYTYKKITPCDVCSQVLRGHTRQGLKCRLCKMNVHLDCQERVGKCQTKSRLLRRQKSSSEIEARTNQNMDDEELVAGRPGRSASPEGSSKGFNSPRSVTFRTPLAAPPSSSSNRGGDPGSPSSGGSGSGAEGYSSGGGGGGSGSGGVVGSVSDTIYSTASALKTANDAVNERGSGGVRPSMNRTRQLPQQANPGSAGSSHHHHHQATSSDNAGGDSRRRRLFGMKGFGVFGSKSADRAISLPESAMCLPYDGWVGASYKTAPHSPRRQKLNLRMKSLSLDSPESSEVSGRRRQQPHSAQGSSHASSHSSSSRLQSPSSPVHSRRLLSAKNMRMSSVELPDDNEKSISSASTSPCPSPVCTEKKKPHRLLPTNLYVVLYNFKSRHPDELDLKAGYKLTVIDSSDPDWWRGKCLGRVGYFPSKYVAKVQPGEKALQVTHNLQVADCTLLRDQIVIQIGEEVDGMVMIRCGDNRQAVCPIKYLTEV